MTAWYLLGACALLLFPSYPVAQEMPDTDIVIEFPANPPLYLESFTLKPLTLTTNRLNLVHVTFDFRADDKSLRGGLLWIKPVSIVGEFDYGAENFSYTFNDKRYRKATGSDEFSFCILCEGWQSMVLEARLFNRDLLNSAPQYVTIVKAGKKPKERQGSFLGERAYDFQLYNQNGKLVRLSKYRGQVVFIHFFSPACSFSKQLSLLCDQWQSRYGSQGFVPMTLVYQDVNAHRISRGAAAKWAKNLGLNHPVLDDISASVRTIFMDHGWAPSYLLLDREGRIVVNDYGITTEKQILLEHKIETLLQK